MPNADWPERRSESRNSLSPPPTSPKPGTNSRGFPAEEPVGGCSNCLLQRLETTEKAVILTESPSPAVRWLIKNFPGTLPSRGKSLERVLHLFVNRLWYYLQAGSHPTAPRSAEWRVNGGGFPGEGRGTRPSPAVSLGALCAAFFPFEVWSSVSGRGSASPWLSLGLQAFPAQTLRSA